MRETKVGSSAGGVQHIYLIFYATLKLKAELFLTMLVIKCTTKETSSVK